MVDSYYYKGNQYVPRTAGDGFKGYIEASVASGAIMAALPLCCKPFEKQLAKEHSSNHLYKDALYKALEVSGLDKKGVSIIPMQHAIGDNSYIKGKNAAYFPKEKVVRINTDKISVAGFHELGHALNDLKGKAGKVLSKLRYPGYVAAGYLGLLALFSTTKPKESKRNLYDWVKDNCGKLAFVCMLPTVLEEGMASYKGLRLAKQSGLSKPLIKNMQKLYGKALLTYVGHAGLAGLAAGAANMIMQKHTRPEKIDGNNLFDIF